MKWLFFIIIYAITVETPLSGSIGTKCSPNKGTREVQREKNPHNVLLLLYLFINTHPTKKKISVSITQ